MKILRPLLLLLVVFASALPTMAQHEGICTNPDVRAQFPGGKEALHRWVNDHIVYPRTDRFIPPTGRNILRLTIDTDGSVIYSTPVKKSGYDELEYASTDCISLMPRWTPAQKEGKAVKSYVFLPFNYKTTDSAVLARQQGGISPEKMKQMLNIEYSVIDDNAASIGVVSAEAADDGMVYKKDSLEPIKEEVRENPEFPGGLSALSRWLSANLRYPENAIDNYAQGRVLVQFEVEADGSVTDAKLLNHIFPELDREALRVVNSMPAWKPGTVDGEPVRCSFRLPVNFALTPDQDEITVYFLDN